MPSKVTRSLKPVTELLSAIKDENTFGAHTPYGSPQISKAMQQNHKERKAVIRQLFIQKIATLVHLDSDSHSDSSEPFQFSFLRNPFPTLPIFSLARICASFHTTKDKLLGLVSVIVLFPDIFRCFKTLIVKFIFLRVKV